MNGNKRIVTGVICSEALTLYAIGCWEQGDLRLVEPLGSSHAVRRFPAGRGEVHGEYHYIPIIRERDGLNGLGAGQIEGVTVEHHLPRVPSAGAVIAVRHLDGVGFA